MIDTYSLPLRRSTAFRFSVPRYVILARSCVQYTRRDDTRVAKKSRVFEAVPNKLLRATAADDRPSRVPQIVVCVSCTVRYTRTSSGRSQWNSCRDENRRRFPPYRPRPPSVDDEFFFRHVRQSASVKTIQPDTSECTPTVRE